MIWELVSLPPELGSAAFASVVFASFAGSLITAALGIGGGGLLLAVLATLLPTAALIPVHGVVQLGSNAGRMGIFFRRISWAALPGFAVGSVIGCGIGGLVVIELPSAAVQIGVGCFVIWTVVARAPAWVHGWPFLTGGISSFLTMFFGATGLFVASYTKSLSLDRHAHVATHAALMTIQHLLKVLVFGLLGFAFAPWGMVILVMIIAGAAGTVAGRLVLNRMDDRLFRRALDLLLIAISARLIWSGLTAIR